MGDPRGFLKHGREVAPYRPVAERIKDFRDINTSFQAETIALQASRCMDCGIPFCQSDYGCPVSNQIPHWNDHLYKGNLAAAIEALHSTNNFPEFTGRVCPAPCETACTLEPDSSPVAIKQTEMAIIQQAWDAGLVEPNPPKYRTEKRVAVIGSGPSGLAAAQQLNYAGHHVTVYERASRIGGLLTYGIPDFKMDKRLVTRRLEQLTAEGIEFVPNADVGKNYDAQKMHKEFDAIVLAIGATQPRDIAVPGRELGEIHFAVPYLTLQNRMNAGDALEEMITARGKHVIVIGGGDTGSDCIGTAVRQGAKSITQFELLPKPPAERTAKHPWPQWPFTYKQSSSHEEAMHAGIFDGKFEVNTTGFSGDGQVERIHAHEVEWKDGRFSPKAGSEFELPADLVLIAAGFVSAESYLTKAFGLELDRRGRIRTTKGMQTSDRKIFAAGDGYYGQSLVVRAIAMGRDAAQEANIFLGGTMNLPRSNHPRPL
ncbi:glutamate synthase subunit beta [Candidatus Woesearchaeota archaeon]|nr:glutamate synthase subunit beta [Candidatus Woesearchaeota archaeon]